MTHVIYKIAPKDMWDAAQTAGTFLGAPVDVADGFIHFSTAQQALETAAKHFAGQKNLVLAAIDGGQLGDKLKYEPSRGGDLFPHLYGPLDMTAVLWVADLPLGAEGTHVFPNLEPSK